MTGYTHIAGGALAGSIVLAAAGINVFDTKILMAAAAAGSLLPDIDHTGSKISRTSSLSSVLSRVLKLFTKHRGVIHTPFFLLILCVLSGIGISLIPLEWQTTYRAVITGLLAGYLSHLLLDTLNPGGIMWMFPVKKKYYHAAEIKTGSMAEPVVLAALTLPAFLMFKYLI